MGHSRKVASLKDEWSRMNVAGPGVGILGSCPGRSAMSESLDSWLALGEVPMEERVQAGLTMESSWAPWLTGSQRGL